MVRVAPFFLTHGVELCSPQSAAAAALPCEMLPNIPVTRIAPIFWQAKLHFQQRFVFGRPFVKRFALCFMTVVCPVCDVGVLWPNDWMDQDETWHGGIGFGPGHIVLDGD